MSDAKQTRNNQVPQHSRPLVQKKKPPKKNGNRLFVGSDFSY